jgi:cytochrome c553
VHTQGHCHAETGKGLPQTVATRLEAQHLFYFIEPLFNWASQLRTNSYLQ